MSYLAWSPDGRYLLAAGPEDCPDLWIWNVDTEQLHLKMNHSQEDSLTAAAWHAGSDRFVCGGARGQFYSCSLDGGVLSSWDGVRVNALACRGDGRSVLAADTHHRVRAYDFTDLADRNLCVYSACALRAALTGPTDSRLNPNVPTGRLVCPQGAGGARGDGDGAELGRHHGAAQCSQPGRAPVGHT